MSLCRMSTMSKHKPYHNGSFPRTFDKNEPPPLSEATKPLPSKAWKKKYKCKKNKGDHDWAILSLTNWFEYTIKTEHGKGYGSWKPGQENRHNIPVHQMAVMSKVEWRCRACNKHEMEWLSSDPSQSLFGSWRYKVGKKLDPYRQNYL